MAGKHIRGRTIENLPNPVDVHFGQRARLRRKILGMSQAYVARKLGLTFQQIQKYEKGTNRIGASRLFDLARLLEVDLNYFTEDMDEKIELQSPMMSMWTDQECSQFVSDKDQKSDDIMERNETLKLVNNYYRIKNRRLSKCLFILIALMSRPNAVLPGDPSPVSD